MIQLARFVSLFLLLTICGAMATAEPLRKGDCCANILTGNFPYFTVLNDLSFLDIGMEYERFLDTKRLFSINVAGYVGVLLRGQQPSSGTNGFAAPGFRYHPGIAGSKSDLSVGVQVAFGNLSTTVRHSYTESFTAILLQTGANFFPVRHGVVGLHVALGPMVSPHVNKGFFFQAGLKYGGRF